IANKEGYSLADGGALFGTRPAATRWEIAKMRPRMNWFIVYLANVTDSCGVITTLIHWPVTYAILFV
ncbi:hypothetical protein R0J89_21750, partial [Psychrobacter sp. SIMBA_152]